MERAILASLALRDRGGVRRAEESMEELRQLAVSAGAEVVGTVIQERESPDPRCYLGRGKVEEMVRLIANTRAALVVFDQELSPGQQGNLEEEWGVKVLGRTGLILDIFAQRAGTREGKLQVELAQLAYLLTRLVGGHRELSRLGGGIGTRGPGEKKLEQDRRRIKKRMSRLNAELDRVKHHRALYRRTRRQASLPVAVLVGYTNAGKSTLLHALTGAEVRREDRLFSTLDPTTRRLRLPGGRVVLMTDTVGFIRHLPHLLVAAFKSTLEEVLFADLVLHVIDLSQPDHEERAQVVRDVLAEIGAGRRPVLEIYNKIDLLPEGSMLEKLARRSPGAAFISARSGLSLERLTTAMEDRLRAAAPPEGADEDAPGGEA